MNERKTENIARKMFEKEDGFVVEEQKSDSPRVQKLLQRASKSGSGAGKPEFIIRSENQPDLLVVVECKADPIYHESGDQTHYKDFAVDGALLYSSYLSKEFDVVALAISGEDRDQLKVSGYLQLRSEDQAEFFTDQLLTLSDIEQKYLHDSRTKHQRYEELLTYNKELNQKLHNKKIQEDKRSLLISGIIIALDNDAFRKNYRNYDSSNRLTEELVNTISHQLKNDNIEKYKLETLQNAYSFIKSNKSLSEDLDFLKDLITEIDEKVNSFVKTYKYYDIFGEFYTEFLRYANDDKGLGIVLTPKHITELFADLASVDKNSVVFDNCCGTGGFLIAAMRKMVHECGGDEDIERRIKEQQIVGVEYQDTIFPLVCSNMIVHGDGKNNLFNEDCFYPGFSNYIYEQFRPDVGILNPPYKTDANDTEEMEFVMNMLEALERGGTCVALVPIQCALADRGKKKELKERLMRHHTLEAVLSMPDQLFHNSDTSVITATMVITAKEPHPSNKETFLGYFKDDGFIVKRHVGRVDEKDRWEEVREELLYHFVNRKEKPGLSVNKQLTPDDEWCAEAYMETDYSAMTKHHFEKVVKNFLVFRIGNDDI